MIAVAVALSAPPALLLSSDAEAGGAAEAAVVEAEALDGSRAQAAMRLARSMAPVAESGRQLGKAQ